MKYFISLLCIGLFILIGCEKFKPEKASEPNIDTSEFNSPGTFQIIRPNFEGKLPEPTILIDTRTGKTWQLKVSEFGKDTNGNVGNIDWKWFECEKDSTTAATSKKTYKSVNDLYK